MVAGFSALVGALGSRTQILWRGLPGREVLPGTLPPVDVCNYVFVFEKSDVKHYLNYTVLEYFYNA